MEKENQSNEVKTQNKTSKISVIRGWVFGILLILIGLSVIGKNIIPGLLLIITGIIITPVILKLMKNELGIFLSRKHKIALVVIVCLVSLIIGLSGGPKLDESSNVENVVEKTKAAIGDTAFLRLEGISDPEQVICLGSTEEEFSQVGKSLLAKDFIGLLEIPGAFCVSNGTKVQVIDSAYGVRKVRILEGVREVDSDKVYRSGWTAMEWVVLK